MDGITWWVVAGGGGGGGDWIGSETPVDNNNILFYYDFEDGNADDKSGNANHGSDVNGNAITTASAKNGTYRIKGDGLYGSTTSTTRLYSPVNLPFVSAQGLTFCFWIYVKNILQNNTYYACPMYISGSTYLQQDKITDTDFRLKPSSGNFYVGALNTWNHMIIKMGLQRFIIMAFRLQPKQESPIQLDY
jgi:hypothetical protein